MTGSWGVRGDDTRSLPGCPTWSLPGYDVEEMLGFGATGEVWRARQRATGETVALKRLRPGAGPAAVEALRREAAVLRTLDSPYVVGLRDVVGTGSEAVLVLDHAAGGSLAALLSRRGHLSPAEVVTVAAPLAEALAAAHARGLVHGDVSPSNVLFTADGMPLLTDLGLAGRLGEQPERLAGTAEYVDPGVVAGRAPDAASDVWALGALCFHLLAGCPPHEGAGVDEVLAGSATGSRAPLGLLAPTTPRSLVAVVESALAGDPSARPAAEDLALALHRAQAAGPVRLTGELPPAAPLPDLRETHAVPRRHRPVPAPRRRRLPRPSGPALAGSGLVLLLLSGGLAWALAGSGSAAPSLPPVPAAPAAAGADGVWLPVLDRLDAQRARAFAAADPALLAAVYVPGAAVGAADTAAVRALAADGHRAQGVRHEVRSVRVRSATAQRVELRVVDVLSPQVVTDVDGAEVQALPGRGPAAFDVTLVGAGDGWRISAVAPRAQS
jgi:hypothetical protein